MSIQINEKIMNMIKAFSDAEKRKNLEFVTEENGFSYHVGYKTIDGNVIYFVTKKDLDDKDIKEVKEITESDYKKICKGKYFVVDCFK